MISMIAAMSKNRVIGKNNDLPWKIPLDMKHFRDLTIEKPVIMGRKTYESIGRPLPKRQNIVITTDKNFKAIGCEIAHSIKEAISIAEKGKEIMVVGGSRIYKEFLPLVGKIYLTLVDKEFDGDAFFPEFDEKEWKVTSEESLNDENYSFKFITYERN